MYVQPFVQLQPHREPKEDAIPIYVYALTRPSRVEIGPGRVQVQRWDGSLPLALFHFTIAYPLHGRDDVFRAFWPHLAVKDATNVFHVSKRKVTEVLSLALGHTAPLLTTYEMGYYSHSPDYRIWCDAARLLDIHRMLQSGDAPDEMTLIQEALVLSETEYLEQMTHAWMKDVRALLAAAFVDISTLAGKRLVEHDRPDKALVLFQRALHLNPIREDALRGYMQVCAEQGMAELAAQAYQTFLKQTQAISPETTALAEQLAFA